ncbi:MAG: HprK-related kinase A, partial [Rhizorhabdus sp.]
MHALHVRIGPVSYRIGAPWPGPIAALRQLYAGYPAPEDGIATVTARIG